MNYELFAPLLGEWAPRFRPFIESKEMDKIYEVLKRLSLEGRTICPAAEDVFRAFKETPVNKLNTIFFLQD